MMSNQELLQLIASATSDDSSNFKSIQELIRIIAACVGIDEDTGEAYIKVKDTEDTNLGLSNAPLNNTLGFGFGSPSVSTLDAPNEEES